VDQAAAHILRPLLVAWSAVLGAAVCSFLNVVIARVPHGRSVVRPGSACPRCGAAIGWYDNVPVLSWLLLRARCRRCRAPISARYPLVEGLMAGLAAAAALRHGASGAALAELAFVALLVALAFIDLDTWLLPWALTLPLAALAILAGGLGLTPAGSLGAAALGGGIGFASFLVIHLVGEKVFHREALGFGDVVLLGRIGAWLGPRALLPVVLLSSLQGAVVGVAMLLLGKGEPGPTPPSTPTPAHPEREPGDGQASSRRAPTPNPTADDDWIPPRHAIPYGPFLALAALEWLFLARPLARLVPVLSLFLGR
jgi:leader peptidase (prepilin peptidase)/N-methyltransferase